MERKELLTENNSYGHFVAASLAWEAMTFPWFDKGIGRRPKTGNIIPTIVRSASYQPT
jgi:hypothetical protein